MSHKILLHRKGNHQENKRQPTKQEKISANQRGKYPKYIKNSYNSQ